jgi:hypothetical protein
MNHNGERTILKLLTSFLPLHMMNLVNTVIVLKLISMYFARFNSDDNDDHIDQCVVNAHSTEIESDTSTINVPQTISKKSPDYNKLRPFFGWLDADIIKNTFDNTTQYAQ